MTDLEEKEKWDRIYRDLPVSSDETDHQRRFTLEFSQKIQDLLPQGGKTLEAGSGAGLQSLALARTGNFAVSLLDFSSEALNHARVLFGREDLPVTLIEADANQPGAPEYDLVFNAGVLEHYTFEQQVTMLQSMASRSRGYVLVLVPNQMCYWYWIWRIQKTSQQAWEFGTEVPFSDLGPIFTQAGLKFLGHAFLGKDWSESFILSLEGITPEFRDQLLDIQRNASIPLAQKSYLVAGLGCVAECALPQPAGWWLDPSRPGLASPEYTTQQAEWVATFPDTIIQLNQEVAGLNNRAAETARQLEQKNQQIAALEQAQAALEQSYTRLEQSHSHLLQQNLELNGQVTQLAQQALERQNQLAEAQNQLGAARALIHEIQHSRGWRLVQAIWRVRLTLLPNGSRRFNLVRGLFRGVKPKAAAPAAARKSGPLRLLDSRQMSWYAYAFDRFKRQWSAYLGSDLRRLNLPAVPGMVSIVLPVYNGARMVGESIESILAGTYPNFEIIAINDGSSDDTAAVLDEYARRDARIRVVHQENRRLPRTLSRGFRMARGEFLTWTSDDNHFKPNYLERMVQELRGRAGVDMIYANEDIIGEDGQPLTGSDWFLGYQNPRGSEHVHLPKDPSELNIYPNNYVGAAFLYRKHVAWLVGDYSTIRFTTEDYDYFMQVNALLRLRHTRFEEPVYEYRFHSRSLTSKDKEYGITRSRVRLMVFDDFRRDFYQSPLTWHLVSASGDAAAQALLAQVRALATRGGHTLVEDAAARLEHWPRLWVPHIYLQVSTDPAQLQHLPLEKLPPNTLKVALWLGGELPLQVAPEWDLCVALGPYPNPPALAGEYQGWVTSADLATLVAAVDIRARTDHLRGIETEMGNPVEPKFRASVIICTYKRHKPLRDALASTVRQSLDLSQYEVIVVNNAADDTGVADILNEFRQKYFAAAPEQLKLVYCPLTGLSHARNAGIAEARGEILCFLDDDAVAEEHWLEYTCQAFDEHPQVGVVGGHIRVVPPQPRPAAVPPGWERFWSEMITGFSSYTEVSQWYEFPWGANWCARRQALVESGGFRTRYGRRRSDFGGGEEIIEAAMIQQLGYTIAILPQSEVLHIPDAQRFTFEDVRKTIRAGLRVQYGMQKDLYIPLSTRENWDNLVVECKKLWQLRQSGATSEPLYRELNYRVRARIELLKDQVLDLFKRLRKPISA